MPRIDELWAWISEDDGPEDEGLVGLKIADSWLPLVGPDRARIESYRWLAQKTAKQTGKSVRLVCFSVRTEMEVLE